MTRGVNVGRPPAAAGGWTEGGKEAVAPEVPSASTSDRRIPSGVVGLSGDEEAAESVMDGLGYAREGQDDYRRLLPGCKHPHRSATRIDSRRKGRKAHTEGIVELLVVLPIVCANAGGNVARSARHLGRGSE